MSQTLEKIKPNSDSLKESKIEFLMSIATSGDKPKPVREAAFKCVRTLIDSRSPGQVLRMERERGLV